MKTWKNEDRSIKLSEKQFEHSIKRLKNKEDELD